MSITFLVVSVAGSIMLGIASWCGIGYLILRKRHLETACKCLVWAQGCVACFLAAALGVISIALL